MIALYHFDRSTAAQKVRLSLAEKGLAWESRYVDPGLRPADPCERAQMRLWTKLVDEGLHVDSRTIGQCIAIRFVMQDVVLQKITASWGK